MAHPRIGRPMGSFPQETVKYSCETGPGSDAHGQLPPTDTQPIRQRARLAGDPVTGMAPRTKMRSRQFNRGGY